MYLTPNNLSGLGATSAAKAQKKLVKIAAKEAKHDAKIAAKVAKYGADSAKAKKVLAKEAKHDTKLSAKIAKYQAAANSQALATPVTAPPVVTPPPTSSTPAPVAAAESVATLAPSPTSLVASSPAPVPGSMFDFGTPTDSAGSQASAAPAESGSNMMPIILGVAALGAILLLGKKKRG